jgi:hypothetical protein
MIAKYNHIVGVWRPPVAWQVAAMINLALLLGNVNFLDGSHVKNAKSPFGLLKPSNKSGIQVLIGHDSHVIKAGVQNMPLAIFPIQSCLFKDKTK